MGADAAIRWAFFHVSRSERDTEGLTNLHSCLKGLVNHAADRVVIDILKSQLFFTKLKRPSGNGQLFASLVMRLAQRELLLLECGDPLTFRISPLLVEGISIHYQKRLAMHSEIHT